MSQNLYEDLLDYYQQEMIYLKQSGAQFAQKYPHIAESLHLTGTGSSDPHVERLLESFAFLTARLQKEINNKYIRFSNTLLETLYPQFVLPFPSAAIAQVRLSPHLGKVTAGHVLPKGTKLFTKAEGGETCRFTTCYDTELWPFEVIEGGIVSIDDLNISQNAVSTQQFLKIRISRYDGALKELKPQNLRFHLAGDRLTTNFLYDAIFTYDPMGDTPVFIQGDKEDTPRLLPLGKVKAVGFEDNENLVPFPQEVHRGYQYLQEYFCFASKFKFIDIESMDLSTATKYVDILIPLAAGTLQNSFQISKNNFQLGCTPIVNLFSKISEPIDLNQRSLFYRLIPDQRNEATTEVHSILKVLSSVRGSPNPVEYIPYFSYNHGMEKEGQSLFWHSFRVPTDVPGASGSDLNLAFVDFNFTPDVPASETLYAHLLCTNRDLATYIPAGASLQVDGEAPPLSVVCLTRPTPPVPPNIRGDSQWKLISQLSLNHLTLGAGEDPSGQASLKSINGLKEILRLYADANKGLSNAEVGLLSGISFERMTRRMGKQAWRGFVQGLAINLESTSTPLDGNGTLLLSLILSHFMRLYVSMNSFTQLSLKPRQTTEIWKKWPAHIGSQNLL